VIQYALQLPAVVPSLLASGWGDWWLPTNYSKHGTDVDMLFNWIFWLTMIIFVVVEAVMLYFLIKYRAKPGRKKAIYTQGNTRLEMTWTLAPAVILALLALFSKKVWDNFRYSPDLTDPNRAKVLVIGQQFKWNIIYPGPDGKFGRYLLFPRPTDVAWPPGPDGKPTEFADVPGPASLKYDDAVKAIGQYIDTVNPLGKDFTDPDGKDDDYQAALARTLYVPVDRPTELEIASKDVIHDFYMPNFRAQLYAVPGMRGKFVFTATKTTKDMEAASHKTYSIDELPAVLEQPAYSELTIDIDEHNEKAVKDRTGWRYVVNPSAKRPVTIIRDQATFGPGVVEKLKAAGITQVTAHMPGYLDIACAQICGLGHYTMQGRVVVLSQNEYDQKFPTFPHVPGQTAMALNR
jgi:heme/copper-type cytochrome/quinol oxidase subunit 2